MEWKNEHESVTVYFHPHVFSSYFSFLLLGHCFCPRSCPSHAHFKFSAFLSLCLDFSQVIWSRQSIFMFKTHSSYTAVATHNHAPTHTLLTLYYYAGAIQKNIIILSVIYSATLNTLVILCCCCGQFFITNYECVCLHDVIIKDILYI